ncbi:DUF1800 domain-containing protein [Nocardioides sp. Leaf307]|uniref:DUF1800 domain-containing protein n=1 Tax=Nocardioides sp. Leaf307 TaxID=1736331 RepID=UPI0009EB79F2|nr:DUF1800 domain-containing protein [Nocardioides sp. Leaf307]
MRTPRLVSATYAPGRYARTPVLGAGARHLTTRFSYGVTPELTAEVKAAGGGMAWFREQLATADSARAEALADWWPDLHRGPADLWQRQVTDVRGTWEVMYDYARRVMARRITSRQQVLEVMTEFWEGHLHVPAIGDAQAVWRAPYGEIMRRHALGRFDEMLVEAITHPSMLIFLDGATSTKAHPNENLGRELLELHTLGVGNYTEDDVKASARILTGYRVDLWRTWAATYRPEDHWTGPVQVAGFSHDNAAADGREVVRAYLVHLAHHPATARRIARKLALRFVSDTPSDALVERLAATYLANDTAIKPVLMKLVNSREFRTSRRTKLRDPAEDVVATYRALGLPLEPPSDGEAAANAMIWQSETIGLKPFAWPRPDGQPLTNAAWDSPARALASMAMHWSMSGGWWPEHGTTYKKPTEWVPEFPIVFRDLVDHMARRVHARPSSASLLQGACTATGIAPDATITADHALMKWHFPRLLAALLDHPDHYLR